MQAANKCYQLSITLQSMAKTLSYEDVQTAAMSIAECANNVLTVRIGVIKLTFAFI